MALPSEPAWWLLMGADEASLIDISKQILQLYHINKVLFYNLTYYGDIEVNYIKIVHNHCQIFESASIKTCQANVDELEEAVSELKKSQLQVRQKAKEARKHSSLNATPEVKVFILNYFNYYDISYLY